VEEERGGAWCTAGRATIWAAKAKRRGEEKELGQT